MRFITETFVSHIFSPRTTKFKRIKHSQQQSSTNSTRQWHQPPLNPRPNDATTTTTTESNLLIPASTTTATKHVPTTPAPAVEQPVPASAKHRQQHQPTTPLTHISTHQQHDHRLATMRFANNSSNQCDQYKPTLAEQQPIQLAMDDDATTAAASPAVPTRSTTSEHPQHTTVLPASAPQPQSF